MKRFLAFGFLLLAGAATTKAEGTYCGEMIDHGEPSGYRVVGFDAATNTWTIIRNGTFDGNYLVKRLTVAC
jgi:hypothetical protein